MTDTPLSACMIDTSLSPFALCIPHAGVPANHTLRCALLCLSPLHQGVYLVAETAEAADAWVDALLLCHHIVNTRSPETLAQALAPTGHHTQQAYQQQGRR